MTPEIDFVGIINTRGRLVQSLGNDCIDMPREQREMFFMKIALRTAMQRDFDEYLEPVNYCMTQRGDRKFISIPTFDNNTVLAVIKDYSDHEGYVKNIIQALKDSNISLEIFSPKEVKP